jgi:glyoxylase-like metal-dependent hydrolase (beta-lactamase superfamily II)
MKIHQVKTRLVNTYVVEYPDRIFVMDVAVRCHRYVLGFIEHELKRNIQDVTLVICSHDDPDHMGGARQLATLCGAELAIPHHAGMLRAKIQADPVGFLVRAVTALREGFRARMWNMYFSPERHRLAKKSPRYTGKREPSNHIADKQRLRLTGNECLPGFTDWRVLHTPGHSWDSCCFYHAQTGSLLSGDTLLGSAKQNRVVVPSIYANGKQMESSLKFLRTLNIRTVYPGHGSVIGDSPSF